MANTENFRRQHDKLLGLAADIEKMVAAGALSETANHIRAKFSELMGVLSIHLSAEDKNLYPALIQSGDALTRSTAQKYQAEMGDLGKVVGEFNAKWTVAYISTSAAFPREWKTVLSALGARIQRENSVLYPLADKQG